MNTSVWTDLFSLLFKAREDQPLLWRDRLRAAVLCRALLTPVPLVGHERFVDSKVLDIRLQDVHDVCLTGNHHELEHKNTLHSLISCKSIIFNQESFRNL